MNRRNTLKKMLLTSGTLLTLPAWAEAWTLDNVRFTSAYSPFEQTTLRALVDAIIPEGKEIGALSVGVDKFLLKLIEQCYEKEVQENIKKQLKSLDTLAQKNYGKSFNNCEQTQRQELFLACSNSENKAEKDFFELIKSETIRGFRTSREVMTTYLGYKVIPGHYYGCVEINQ